MKEYILRTPTEDIKVKFSLDLEEGREYKMDNGWIIYREGNILIVKND